MMLTIYILVLLMICVNGSDSFEEMMVVRFCDSDGDNVLRKEEVKACLSRVGPEQRSSFSGTLIEHLNNHNRRRMTTTNCHTNDNDLCSYDGCGTCVSGYNEYTCLNGGGSNPEWCACEFLTPHNGPNEEMVCVDGHICNGRNDGWDCCASHGNRKQCPKNRPHMCGNPNYCGGGTTYCCEAYTLSCYNKGGVRQCNENTCGEYYMASNLVAGPSDGCTNGIQLTTKSDKTCTFSLDFRIYESHFDTHIILLPFSPSIRGPQQLENINRYRVMCHGIQRIRWYSRLCWKFSKW